MASLVQKNCPNEKSNFLKTRSIPICESFVFYNHTYPLLVFHKGAFKRLKEKTIKMIVTSRGLQIGMLISMRKKLN